MRVVMISDYETHGGAAIAAHRLAIALSGERCDVSRIVYIPDRNPPAAPASHRVAPAWTHGLLFRAAKKLAPKTASSFIWRYATAPELARLLERLKPDVINVHNLHGAWWAGASARVLAACCRLRPTVWTLHDMWSFTGCCRYSLECGKYVQGCDDECPVANEYYPFSSADVIDEWNLRRGVLADHPNLVAVSPSRWLAALAKAGLWRQHRVEVIPNGIPVDVYRPVERAAARARFGISESERVLMVNAGQQPHYKGLSLIAASINTLRNNKFTLLAIGGELPGIDAPGVTIVNAGFITGERLKAEAFCAADVYIHASRADNLPNTILESILCGTPVLAVNAGGVPEAVRPPVTGWLVDDWTPAALAAAIESVMRDLPWSDDRRARCRDAGVKDFNARLQAQRYIALFQQL